MINAKTPPAMMRRPLGLQRTEPSIAGVVVALNRVVPVAASITLTMLESPLPLVNTICTNAMDDPSGLNASDSASGAAINFDKCAGEVDVMG
jgi:hypothetical protein